MINQVHEPGTGMGRGHGTGRGHGHMGGFMHGTQR